MKRNQLDAVLLLAGIEVIGVVEIPNEYHSSFREHPWYEVTTKDGILKIGPRKRVYNLDYSRTAKRGEVTQDDVTKSDTYAHAWSTADLVKYLTTWREMPYSEDFRRTVAKGRPAILDYFETHGKTLLTDPAVSALLGMIEESGTELTKITNPITKVESMWLWTGRSEICFDFPQ